MPPHLAGRQREKREFVRLLDQTTILENLVLTGLRGVGKTVLLDTFKPSAIAAGWLWVGTDLSESASLSEEKIAQRLITDLSVATSSIVVATKELTSIGFESAHTQVQVKLGYDTLMRVYNLTPGLVIDKLKAVVDVVWHGVQQTSAKGVIFAYDEAQNLTDHSERGEYPMSLLLDLFQSTQKRGIPFMVVLTGLPTLFPKMVEARTFAERMCHVMFLDRLSDEESAEAIRKPIAVAGSPVKLTDESVEHIVRMAGGYPYFIQFICKETYDAFIQGQESVPSFEIIRKLDTDFFAGRWGRATDRQRELLYVIAMLPTCDGEFTVSEIVERSKELLEKPFSNSHVSQMLNAVGKAGLIYKNRYGKYSFAVPLMRDFIKRQAEEAAQRP